MRRRTTDGPFRCILFDRELIQQDLWDLPAEPIGWIQLYQQEGPPREFHYAGRVVDMNTEETLLRFYVENDQPFDEGRLVKVELNVYALRHVSPVVLSELVTEGFIHKWLHND